MINCYHWLLCVGVFFVYSPDYKNLSLEEQRSLPMQPVMQAWAEYDRGYSELCPQFQTGQQRRRECSDRARKQLRGWLDEEAEACLKVAIPSEIPLTNRTCRPGADAVFSYIVRYRESE